MTQSMIETVARALYDATPFKQTAGGFEEQSDVYQRMCMVLARAAIEAMRVPTEAMVEEGYCAVPSFGDHNPNAAWRAMIDAALNEQVTG